MKFILFYFIIYRDSVCNLLYNKKSIHKDVFKNIATMDTILISRFKFKVTRELGKYYCLYPVGCADCAALYLNKKFEIVLFRGYRGFSILVNKYQNGKSIYVPEKDELYHHISVIYRAYLNRPKN
jgi:hypothetical protein